MRIDFVQNALKALRPDTPDWYGWATHDANGNKITIKTGLKDYQNVEIIEGLRPENEIIKPK